VRDGALLGTPSGRPALAAALWHGVDDSIHRVVLGSPFFIVDEERSSFEEIANGRSVPRRWHMLMWGALSLNVPPSSRHSST